MGTKEHVDRIGQLVAEARKALVAVGTPIVTALVIDVAAELSLLVTGAIAGAASGLVVYLTRNEPQQVK